LINIYLLARGGQSIGKRLAGIKLVAPDGSRLSVLRVLGLRMLAPAIPSAGGLVLYVIGPYVANQYVLSLTVYPLVIAYVIFRYALVLRADRRGLHDHIAGTIVISAVAERTREAS
jgi:uncharacterized RDD family membrane protein YckC